MEPSKQVFINTMCRISLIDLGLSIRAQASWSLGGMLSINTIFGDLRACLEQHGSGGY